MAMNALDELEQLFEAAHGRLDVAELCRVSVGDRSFPVWRAALGNPAPEAPAVGFFGGVHGLERIGADVVIAWLRHLLARLEWDATLHMQLERMRLVFMPIVNPGGLWLGTRANPSGVDLMRNAPLDSPESPRLHGGHRISPRLPWYRGPAGAPMQAESQALCDLVERELTPHCFSIAIDCHSGFGVRDRIWFPHAHTREPIAHLGELHGFAQVMDLSHPHHRYVMEPQSRQYLAHGDLWDHLYLRHLATRSEHPFLPLTLEMGSWLWVRKNPRQLFSREGLFNPLIRHRQERVLRRHLAWFDFVTRAALSHERWLPRREDERMRHRALALERWYRPG